MSHLSAHDPRAPVRYFSRLDAGDPPQFKAAPGSSQLAAVEGSERKIRRLLVFYDQITFDVNVIDSFKKTYVKELDEGALDGVSLTIEIFNKPFYFTSMMVILITAASYNDKHEKALEKLFPAFVDNEQVERNDETNCDTMSGVPDGIETFPLGAKEYECESVLGNLTDVFDWLKGAALNAAHVETQNIQAIIRLEKGNSIYVYAAIFDPANPVTLASEFDLIEPPPLPMKAKVYPQFKRAPPTAPPPEVVAVVDDDLKGIEILSKGTAKYDLERKQYASYDESYSESLFTPYLIAKPKNVKEIERVVNFAAKKTKKVVVRSGGHQYCGFSSGNEDYIQIVMDNMDDEAEVTGNTLAKDVIMEGCKIVSQDGNSEDAKQWFVTIPARYKLKDISELLKDHKLTIPHGECPLVAIGGHVQTGGYGHQMRGLGLCLDYVYSFEIVIYAGDKKEEDGNVEDKKEEAEQVEDKKEKHGKVEDKKGEDGKVEDNKSKQRAQTFTIFRPELEKEEIPLNDAIFKGVLGGSPGAFGVITNIKFLAVHDNDPNVSQSYNAVAILPYRGSKVAESTTKYVKQMLLFTPASNELPDGLDVFISVVSQSIGIFEFGVIVAELAYTGNNYSQNVKDLINQFIAVSSPGVFARMVNNFVGKKLKARPPSQVAHEGVRTTNGGVTKEGREFNLPYKKRVNVTCGEVSGENAKTFAEEFGKLAKEVVDDRDLRLVIQMNLGGGKVKSNDEAGRTGIPYRGQTFGFVFDVFHQKKAKDKATNIQARMQTLLHDTSEKLVKEVDGKVVDKKVGFENRVFWGSFGRESGETDMKKENVQDWYFESTKAYSNILEIKHTVDPTGMFSTEFTV